MKFFRGVEVWYIWLFVSFLVMVLYVSGDVGVLYSCSEMIIVVNKFFVWLYKFGLVGVLEYNFESYGGMESIGSMFFLLFIFVVGVIMGLFWKVSQKVREMSGVGKEIVVVEFLMFQILGLFMFMMCMSNSLCLYCILIVGVVCEYMLKEIQVMMENFWQEFGKGG